jgi:hypothetical protein
MTRQLHAAVPTSETPESRLQKAEHSNEGSMSSIEFLRSTGVVVDADTAYLFQPMESWIATKESLHQSVCLMVNRLRLVV